VDCFLKKWKPQQSPPVLSLFVNVKLILFSLPYVVSIAKQAAQPRAAVFGAGGVPKAFLNRDIKAASTAVLCTFPP
jgi:hypothetical protein